MEIMNKEEILVTLETLASLPYSSGNEFEEVAFGRLDTLITINRDGVIGTLEELFQTPGSHISGSRACFAARAAARYKLYELKPYILQFREELIREEGFLPYMLEIFDKSVEGLF